ncbi:branched-chain amino acid ABC transporter substrate-binding protein [Cryptosporangium sp. NPDC051539]|uniref:branched-chain amino acid ABC transporter substrate-binding protein n=1 Tax=Cryptosporangium sp. NPDC051539 TaxID=3363962 RepID=UPI0037B7CFB6
MRYRHIARIAAIGAAVALAAAGCSSSDSDSSSGGKACDLKIAFFGALTGSAANLGINERNGAKLAVDEYNAKNSDCKVTYQEFDSEGDPAKAPGLARQLVKDAKIVGVVGPGFSGESEAADPIFESAGIPTITPSATRPSLSTKGWKVFHRAVGNDESQGPAAGNYIKTVLKAQKVFVVDDQSAYGAGLADEVKKIVGSAVVGTDKVGADGKQTDFSATVTKIKSSGSTVVFYGGYYQNAGLLRKQLTAAGVTATLVAGDGVNDPGYIKTAGNAAAEGTILTCPCAPASEAKGDFVKNYKAAFNVDPGTYSDVAYDIGNMYLKGIEAGNTNTAKMQKYVNGLNYTGIANTYKFTDKGELDPSLVIVWAFKVTAGKVVPDQEAPKS